MVRYCLVVIAAFLFQSPPAAGSELDKDKFLKLHAELQPDNTAAWRTIPWRLALLNAQRQAATEKKPLFIWAMDGHPLGCT